MNIQSYVDLGWSAFPVKGPYYGKDYDDTKKPIEAWKPYQTRKPTPEEINAWLKQKPKMSVGAVAGPISGFIVVDIDSEDWIKTFPNADFGLTWKSISKRGCHYFYSWEEWMLEIPTTGSEIGNIKGFDIRGLGGYVVVPNENDSHRKWEISPWQSTLSKMPDWIKTFLRQNLSKNGNGSSLRKAVAPLAEIAEGNRHASFLSYTGKLHKAGLSPSEIINILTPVAKANHYESDLVGLVNDVVTRYAINKREALRPESMEALLLESEPPLEWLIEGLWTDKARGFIAGHPGTGKTWIALDMILSVATGGLCMGKYKPAYRAPCLLVEEEASRRNLQRRIHSMARARALAPSDLASVFHITQQFANVPRDNAEIISVIQKHKIKFVVFDSLREVHSAKENSSDEMAVVLRAFKEISVVGDCAVLLIHHLSKSGVDGTHKSIFERMRGTGSLWAWRDCILGVEGEEESTVAKCSFQFRDADSPAPIQITRHVGTMTGSIALQATSLEESEEFVSKSTEITAFVKSQIAGASNNQIFKEIGGHRSSVLGVVKRMEKLGSLVKMGSKYVVPN